MSAEPRDSELVVDGIGATFASVGPNPYLSEDRKEGIAAHLEKRPPRWSGR